MKTDKELLEIFDNKEKNPPSNWEYENLSLTDKSKIFDLLFERELQGGS